MLPGYRAETVQDLGASSNWALSLARTDEQGLASDVRAGLALIGVRHIFRRSVALLKLGIQRFHLDQIPVPPQMNVVVSS